MPTSKTAKSASRRGRASTRSPRPWTVRDSILPELSLVLIEDELKAVTSLGRLAETTSDMTFRMSLYNELLPKQARWQAELLLAELGAPEVLAETRDAVPELTEQAQRAVRLLEDLPDLVERERMAALASVELERKAVLDDLERARLDSHERLIAEREAILRELRARS